jgi:hypothetical protein
MKPIRSMHKAARRRPRRDLIFGNSKEQRRVRKEVERFLAWWTPAFMEAVPDYYSEKHLYAPSIPREVAH